MAAATVPPKKRTTINRRHIPLEIVEEILLNLPVKSLLRFYSVSKSWKSMISQPRFIQRYGSKAAVSDGKRIVINADGTDLINFWSYPLSSMSSDQAIKGAARLVCPFDEIPDLVASCDELWCAKIGYSIFLWNPSMNTYKRVADSPLSRAPYRFFSYGLGYDSVADDYKIFRLSVGTGEAELYSLKNDSWRNIKSFPEKLYKYSPFRGPVFVCGALHWINCSLGSRVIISFDLTTEMYGELAPPRCCSVPGEIETGLTVLKGKLCTYMNTYRTTMHIFFLWVMEEYGVHKSWSTLFKIQSTDGIPHFPSIGNFFLTLKPLCFYDNGDILIEMLSPDGSLDIFIYKNGDALPKRIVGCRNHTKVLLSYVYVESLVSPVMWSKAAHQLIKSS